jgi:DNA-binding NarL/FixJ family response regulator
VKRLFSSKLLLASEVVTTAARIRVLIAEDDAGVREVLASVVRSEPAFEVAGIAEDAPQAILAAARNQPDVAVVDVRMPGGGASATRGIKLCSPHTSVIAFSAYDDPRTRQEMFDAGVDGYLVKGSLVTAIIASIHRAGAVSASFPERRAA